MNRKPKEKEREQKKKKTVKARNYASHRKQHAERVNLDFLN